MNGTSGNRSLVAAASPGNETAQSHHEARKARANDRTRDCRSVNIKGDGSKVVALIGVPIIKRQCTASDCLSRIIGADQEEDPRDFADQAAERRVDECWDQSPQFAPIGVPTGCPLSSEALAGRTPVKPLPSE